MSNPNFREIEYKFDGNQLTFKELGNRIGKPITNMWGARSTYYYNDTQCVRVTEYPAYFNMTVKQGKDIDRRECVLKVPMDQKDNIPQFCNILGMTKTKSLYRSTVRWVLDDIEVVHYTLYKNHREELGRYIELEYIGQWNDLDLILHRLNTECKRLQLNVDERIRKSIYELYIKD